jgi:hypothetical protein
LAGAEQVPGGLDVQTADEILDTIAAYRQRINDSVV